MSRKLEIPRKNEKEMLDIRNTVTKMKNAFDGLVSKLTKSNKELVSFKIFQQKIPKIEWTMKKIKAEQFL